MADLGTLIRLHKHELDEKRLALGKLYEQQAELQRRRDEFERAFEREKEAAAQTGDVHFTFVQYAEKIKHERKMADEARRKLEQLIEAAKESMMATFSELKKFEMTQAERERLAAEERALKEARQMDEIGLEGFRRKSEEN